MHLVPTVKHIIVIILILNLVQLEFVQKYCGRCSALCIFLCVFVNSKSPTQISSSSVSLCLYKLCRHFPDTFKHNIPARQWNATLNSLSHPYANFNFQSWKQHFLLQTRLPLTYCTCTQMVSVHRGGSRF